MKITVEDDRYGDRGVHVTGTGHLVHREHCTDNRIVNVALESGELADLPSTGDAYNGTILRPIQITLHWHRGHSQYDSGAFQERTWTNQNNDTIVNRRHHDEWTLIGARVYGSNVKADGELGKLDLQAGFLIRERPDLVQELIDRHDPATNGWPLEDQAV